MSVEGMSTIFRTGPKILCSVFQDLFSTLVIEKVILKKAPLQNAAATSSLRPQPRKLPIHIRPCADDKCVSHCEALGILRLPIIAATFVYPNRDISIRSEVLPLKSQTRHWLGNGIGKRWKKAVRWHSGKIFIQLSINRRSEWVPTQTATLGLMTELNQSISVGWLDQAVISKLLPKEVGSGKNCLMYKHKWKGLDGVQKCLVGKAASKS